MAHEWLSEMREECKSVWREMNNAHHTNLINLKTFRYAALFHPPSFVLAKPGNCIAKKMRE